METLVQELTEATNRRRLPDPPFRRLIRAQAGISQAGMARAIGVTRSAVTRWEQGTRTPRGRVLAAYLTVLDELMDTSL